MQNQHKKGLKTMEKHECKTFFNHNDGYSETVYNDKKLSFPFAKTAKFHSIFNKKVLEALEKIKEYIEEKMEEGKEKIEYFLEKNEYYYSDVQTIKTFLLNHGYEVEETEEKNDGIEYIVINICWKNIENKFYEKY